MRPTHQKSTRDEAPQTASTPPSKISCVPVTPAPKVAMTPKEYDSYLAAHICNNQFIPTEIPVKETIGKSHLGLMCPQVPFAVDHDAIPLLQGYEENGCPFDCGEAWSADHIELMLERVPRCSATRENSYGSYDKKRRTRSRTITPVW